jgi:DNA polymerase kappa
VQPADEYERKSVGTESTFRDISTKEDLRQKLRHTAEELEKDMARVEVKGRTLVLKVKLHTYEVFTRQVAPPKAVHLADDLYNYSLPMLAKLEKEMPDFRLRLMGLRCTHLISTKKDKGDFFRRRTISPSLSTEKSTDDGQWEVWPDSEFEDAARLERQEEMDEVARLSQEHQEGKDQQTSTADWHEPFGRYKYGSEPNSPAAAIAKAGHLRNQGTSSKQVEEELWDCPICQLPQPANDKAFNDHIDLCLSRQTIKEVVAEAQLTSEPSSRASPEASMPGRPKSSNAMHGKRKGATSDVSDGTVRKQKRLFFT